MPRGIPKSGKRAAGAGRPKKYGEDTKQMRVPISVANKLEDLILFLHELNEEISGWEEIIDNIDLPKNPRYSKAKILAVSIRERINALGIEFKESESAE